MIEILLSLILALTGIVRTVDPSLTAIAEQRALEVSTDATFSHALQRAGTAEVLAWNLGSLDPARTAAEQWETSPDHLAILQDPTLTHIGCGHAIGPDGRDVFACILTGAVEPVGVARSPKPTPAGSTPAGGATPLLPDTALPRFNADYASPSGR